jgi:hypothetical protein
MAGSRGTLLILVDSADHCITPRAATRRQRIWARLHALRLDTALAAGASPEATVPLALRGRALVQPHARRALARAILRLVTEAERPAPVRFRTGSPIRREVVREAADDLRSLADHLLAPAPVSARGVAAVCVLLTDGAGPLYHYGGGPGRDLGIQVRQAIAGLDPLSDW